MPAVISAKSSILAKVLLEVTIAAPPRSRLSSFPSSALKKVGKVSIPDSVAFRAISKAGSTPSTRIPCC